MLPQQTSVYSNQHLVRRPNQYIHFFPFRNPHLLILAFQERMHTTNAGNFRRPRVARTTWKRCRLGGGTERHDGDKKRKGHAVIMVHLEWKDLKKINVIKVVHVEDTLGTLYTGQFILSIQLIKPNYLVRRMVISRAFSVVAPRLWNQYPLSSGVLPLLTSSKRGWKHTYLNWLMMISFK